MSTSPPAPRGLPITAITVVGVGGLVACAVALAVMLGVGSATWNTRVLWAEQADTLIESMERSLVSQLKPVAHQADWVRRRFETGALSLQDRDQLDDFFTGALSATPQVAGIAVVDPAGRSRRWGREDPTPIEEDWSEREVIRNWLASGRARGKPSWQSPFWTPTLDTTVLLHDVPLVRDGEFLGMLGQVVPVTSISVEFTMDYAGEGLVPFVLFGRTRVLAHPLLAYDPGEPLESISALPELEELGDPVLARIWAPDDSSPAMMQGLTRSRASIVRHRDASYMLLFRTIERYGSEPWTVGVYFDTREHGASELRRILLAVGGGLAVLLVSVALAGAIGLRVSHRVQLLAIAARRVEAGDLDTPSGLDRSGIRELDDAASAFGSMVAGLKERALIRHTLGRFVPEQIARRLLDAGGTLEPRATRATVLFCDIEGFTALTESAGPRATVGILNAFFSEMVTVLERHGGIVTQFQGDAILATFNVPIADPEHARNALLAALEMVACTGSREFAGQTIRVRIGVNTGPVIAGAVGAEGRLSYTVHGDAVNLAARLESLNKLYGTRILTSEYTVAGLHGFDLRPLEPAEVRGQSRQVSLYEVRGVEGGAEP